METTLASLGLRSVSCSSLTSLLLWLTVSTITGVAGGPVKVTDVSKRRFFEAGHIAFSKSWKLKQFSNFCFSVVDIFSGMLEILIISLAEV